MSVCLALRLLDCEHQIEKALPVVNEAITSRRNKVLREYLKTVPFEVDDKVVAWRKARVKQLKKVNAPDFLIASEEEVLLQATGKAYREKALDELDLKTLKKRLQMWSWLTRSFDLDKSWDLLHWLCDAGRRKRAAGTPSDSYVHSPIDDAIHGTVALPIDAAGDPLGGQTATDRYNPPGKISSIVAALRAVDTTAWPSLAGEVASSGDPPDACAALDEETLRYAASAWKRATKAYEEAERRGFGVICEFY